MDGSWIEIIDGVKIVHLNGSNYNTGYQHGFYLKDNISVVIRIYYDYFDDYGFTKEKLKDIWKTIENYIPDDYLNEIQGIADGADLSYDDIGVINICHDVTNIALCSGAIAWDKATKNGELIHFRSGDWLIDMKDDGTGTYLQEHQAIIINNPEKNYASMYPTIAGLVGIWGGVNEKGISVGENTCFTKDTSFNGIPCSFRMRMVLDISDNLDEAISIMDSNKTCGWNLFISDANIPKGVILEQTANVSHLSNWEDPIESRGPFFRINHVLRRTNMFLSPECIELERGYYRPNGIMGYLRLLIWTNTIREKGDFYYLIWLHYKALSKGILKYWGSLDLNSSMKMFQDVYRGKTDSLFNIFQKRYQPAQPLKQWVSTPKTGDMLVSFASRGKTAAENPIHHFNLFDLLNSKPPNNPIKVLVELDINGLSYGQELLWKVNTTGENYEESAVVYKDGTAYISSCSTHGGGYDKLFAVNTTNGNIIWSTFIGPGYVGPIIDNDRIYIGTGSHGYDPTNDYILCINRLDGSVNWSRKLLWGTPESIQFDNDNIYFASYSIFALDKKDGKIIWEYPLDDLSVTKPILKDNAFFTATSGGTLYKVDVRNGEKIWQVSISDVSWDNSITADGKGHIFLSIYMDKSINAYDEITGELLWSYQLHHRTFSFNAYHNNVIFISDLGGYVYAINSSSGSLLWEKKIGNSCDISSPTISGGIVFIGTRDFNDGAFFALNETNGDVLWKYHVGASVTAPPTIVDGMMLCGTDNWDMYAFDFGNGNGNWPLHRYDSYNTAFSPYGLTEWKFVSASCNTKNNITTCTVKNVYDHPVTNVKLKLPNDIMEDWYDKNGNLLKSGSNYFIINKLSTQSSMTFIISNYHNYHPIKPVISNPSSDNIDQNLLSITKSYKYKSLQNLFELLSKRFNEQRIKQQFHHTSSCELSIFNKWMKNFGGDKEDRGQCVQQIEDGGYIVTGYTYSYGSGSFDIWLIKIGKNGIKIWDKTFGGNSADIGNSVQQTTDEGYIITGSLSWDNFLYLIKTDKKGNMLWEKTFGGLGQEAGKSVQQTTEGGYIITGYTNSYGAGNSDVWLIKTDSDGNKIWDKTFGGTSYEYGTSVQLTTDGGYMITGYTNSYGAGNSDVWLIKTDSDGNKIWDKTFGGTNEDRGYHVQQTSDGGYIITGITYSLNSPDVFLIKTDKNGDKLWEKIFGGNSVDIGNSVQQTTEGGYIITGLTESFGNGYSDVWLIKTDKNGNKTWDKTFGESSMEFSDSVQQTTDGGFILTGGTWLGVGFFDMLLIKTDSEGKSKTTTSNTMKSEYFFIDSSKNQISGGL